MRVLAIYTGGLPGKNIVEQLQHYFELQLVATVDIHLFSSITGGDVPYSLSSDLTQYIYDHYNDYDGFVVIHSIDNVIYSANLTAFQFSNLGKPIVFTGATLSEDFFSFPGHFSNTEQSMYREMSLRTSLVTAVQLATQNTSDVSITYGSRIVKAVRAWENFTTYNELDLASIRFGIEVTTAARPRNDQPPILRLGFDTNVYMVPRQPEVIIPTPNTYRAILMYAHQDRALPSQFNMPTDTPVFLLGGLGHQKLPNNVFALPPVTPVTALSKLMVGCKHFPTTPELVDYMQHNINGEGGIV
ncbi:MAG: asparaginase domain-containing protein [Patescibacteria group bacterium]|jgi:L-asparaginase